MAATKWKEDIANVLDLMRVSPVQRHRLPAFSLKGEAGMWYQGHFSDDERLTIAWDEFV